MTSTDPAQQELGKAINVTGIGMQLALFTLYVYMLATVGHSASFAKLRETFPNFKQIYRGLALTIACLYIRNIFRAVEFVSFYAPRGVSAQPLRTASHNSQQQTGSSCLHDLIEDDSVAGTVASPAAPGHLICSSASPSVSLICACRVRSTAWNGRCTCSTPSSSSSPWYSTPFTTSASSCGRGRSSSAQLARRLICRLEHSLCSCLQPLLLSVITRR